MEFNTKLSYQYENASNSNLYKFMATNYDISDLARKISAAKYAKINLLNLKKTGNMLA